MGLAFPVLLALLALKSWRNSAAEGEEPAAPAWMGAVDRFGPLKSLGLGAVLSGVNPKNLALSVAAGVAIADGGLEAGQQIGVLVIYVALASVTVGAPVLAYLAASARMRGPLEAMKSWLLVNNSTVMAVLFLVLSAVLLGQGITGLTD